MKKMFIFFTLVFIISCSTVEKSVNMDSKHGNHGIQGVNNVVTNNKNEQYDKLYENIEDKNTFRTQRIKDSIIDVVINGKDVKIIYIRDRIIFNTIKKVFKDKDNVGILYRADFPHLGCSDTTYDVLFLDENMSVASKGIKVDKGVSEGYCSTKMIRTLLLLPKNLIHIENVNVGDMINIVYKDKIPLNRKMIK